MKLKILAGVNIAELPKIYYDFENKLLYDNLIKGPLQKYNCLIESDTIPHLLQMKLNDHDNHIVMKK